MRASQRLILFLLFLPALFGCKNEVYVGFDLAESTVYEDIGIVPLKVKLSRSSRMGPAFPFASQRNNSFAVRVPYTVSGTAISPDNHDLVNGTLVIPPGATEANLEFSLIPGSFATTSTVTVTLGTAEGAILGGSSTHTVTIRRVSVPAINFATDGVTVSESAGTISVGLVAEKPAYGIVTMPYSLTGSAANGVDYTIATGVATIPAGATTGQLLVTLANDGVHEFDEYISITLGDPVRDNARLGTVTTTTIFIDEASGPPLINFNTPGQTVSESIAGITSVSVSASLSEVSNLPVTANFVLSGTSQGFGFDHDFGNGSISIPAGSLQATILFNLISDAVNEPDETIIITLSTATNATIGSSPVHTVTVQDDDYYSELENDLLASSNSHLLADKPLVDFIRPVQTFNEADGSATIKIQLSHPVQQRLTVPYTLTGTAQFTKDYRLDDGRIFFEPGETTASLILSLINDKEPEKTENILLTLLATPLVTPGKSSTVDLTLEDNWFNDIDEISVSDKYAIELSPND